jgi:chromosome partitioning protein
MKVIAVVAQKGGTGKTTLTLALAVEAERSGKSVAIVDLDPQATASKWGDRREAQTPVIVSAQPARLHQVLEAAKDQGAEIVLIDTPARSEQAALEAAKAANLVLVPCRPAIYDLETVSTTVELVRYAGSRPIVVILNGLPPRGTRREQAEDVLRAQEISVCPFGFGYRAAYNDAGTLGLSAQEYDPSGKATEEVKGVYEFVGKLLKDITRNIEAAHEQKGHGPARGNAKPGKSRHTGPKAVAHAARRRA